MKVEILSGNERGLVKDLPQVEAEVAIQTGFAKAAEESAPEAVAEAVLPSAADLDAVAAEQAAADATSTEVADAPKADEQA